MANEALAGVSRYVRRLAGNGRADEPSDAHLLQQFAAGRDERAFADLLRRHGPLVFGVCRQLLGFHDAEDAFQATFLVLARKADSIRSKESLAAWLHRVALNVARTKKASDARRRTHERQAILMARPTPADEAPSQDERRLLHEEVHRLPSKYRVAVVLCYLEGKTHDEAARQLGWPLGTVKGRLARARELLQRRLVRRGLALSSAGLLALVSESLAAAAVPPALARAALQGALAPATGASAAAALAEAALGNVTVLGLKLGMGFLLAFTVLAAGAGAFARWSALQRRGEIGPEAVAVEPEPRVRARLDVAGDPLPPGAVARLGTMRLRHGGEVTTAAFFPGGKTVASGGQDGAIRLWEAATGKEVRHLSGDHVAMAPDGKTWAAWDEGTATTITLFDVATGKRLHEFERRGKTHAVTFSPDGKILAAGGVNGKGLNQLSFWEVATGKELPAPQMGAKYDYVHHLAFSPDSKLLATAGETDGSVRLWELATGKEASRFRALKAGGTEVLSPFAFSPDGTGFVSGGKWLDSGEVDPTVRLWEVSTGKELRQFIGCGLDACGAVVFSPDGRSLVTGHGGSIAVWEFATGKLLRKLEGHQGVVRCLAFSADGKILASGSSDCTLRLWDFATGKPVHPVGGHQGKVTSVAVTADGKAVISAGLDKTIRLWDRATSKETRRLTDRAPVRAIAVSPDGKLMASRSWADARNGSTIAVWDLAAGKELRRSFDRTPSPTLAFSPDSRSLAVGSVRAVYCLDEKGKEFSRAAVPRGEPGSGDLPFVAFSPDSKSFAWSNAATCRTSETATGEELHRFAFPRGRDALASVCWGAFLGDDNTLLLNVDGAFCVWDVARGKELRRFGGDPPQWPSALSADGKTLAAGCEDGTIRLWEVATGKEWRRLRGHHGTVASLAWSADGKVLVSGGADTTVLVWAVPGLLRGRKP